MINCLPFLPLSFHSVFQLSPFIPFPSILYPLITISFLNFLFLSSLPNLPSTPHYSCPMPSFFNDLISLSFMHPTSSLFLLFFSSILSCLIFPSSPPHLHHVLFPPHFLSSSLFFTGPEYIMDASTVCYATYGMFLNPILYGISSLCNNVESMSHYLLNVFFCANTSGLWMPIRLSACLQIHSSHTHTR